MPHLSRILLLSLAANLALGTVLLWRTPKSNPHSNPTSISSSLAQTAEASSQEIAITTATWTALAAGSARDFASRLHDEGFPPAIIRVLLSERMKPIYAERLRAFRPKNKDAYWQSEYGDPGAELSAQDRAARRALWREMDEAMKQAMGNDYELLDPEERATRLQNYGPLPSEKVTQIEALHSDYKEMSDLVSEPLLPEDRDQRRLLAEEKRADLAALLTPAELLEYDLRSSPSASTIQRKLSNFNTTEQEYRALTLIQLEFDRQYGTDNLNAEARNRRNDAKNELEAKLLSALAPERRADYLIATDPAYSPTNNFTRSFNYDSKVTRQIVVLQRTFTQRADALADQNLLPQPQYEAAVAALYRETSNQLSSLLSPKAYEAYQKDDAGKWLTQFKSTPAQPSDPKTP